MRPGRESYSETRNFGDCEFQKHVPPLPNLLPIACSRTRCYSSTACSIPQKQNKTYQNYQRFAVRNKQTISGTCPPRGIHGFDRSKEKFVKKSLHIIAKVLSRTVSATLSEALAGRRTSAKLGYVGGREAELAVESVLDVACAALL